MHQYSVYNCIAKGVALEILYGPHISVRNCKDNSFLVDAIA